MKRSRLNEERGARNAADLKARFKHVSDRAFRSNRRVRVAGYGGQGRTNLTSSGRALAIWLVIGLVAFAVGSFVA